jgi:mannose-6-phosphate isomerase-like protein (cupin superfamily)
MKVFSTGASVIQEGDLSRVEGTRRYRVPVSRAMGAREIAQYISSYSQGISVARRNPVGEEALYVVNGTGACYIDGYSYALARGTAVCVPPGSVYQIENSSGGAVLEIVSVCCPEDEETEIETTPVSRAPHDTKPFRSIREEDVEAIAVSNRSFKLLVNQELGARRMTQFVGVIPPSRAPMHHHTYEEAIYILDGEGCVHTKEGDAEFKSGSSIYLPRLVSHSVENTGSTDIHLLGVFHPSGSPDVAYDD